ncbi:hypothetical protein MycrhDRAFT_7007 [Mycolicibacterium rhodesiae JS60]|nr:hypothetical protein MycrhDRAFT_7007 [Mycolicibacterium rhodesiae JS60]
MTQPNGVCLVGRAGAPTTSSRRFLEVEAVVAGVFMGVGAQAGFVLGLVGVVQGVAAG